MKASTTFSSFEQAIEYSLVNKKISVRKLIDMMENEDDTNKYLTLKNLHDIYGAEREFEKVMYNNAHTDEDALRAIAHIDDIGYDGTQTEDLTLDIPTAYRDNKKEFLFDDEVTVEERIVNDIEWHDIGLVYRGIWSMHKRTMISSKALLVWLDNVKVDDVKRVLRENNIVVLSGNDGTVYVKVGDRVVDNKDITTSMYNIRTCIAVAQKYLQQCVPGSLGSWIYWSRVNSVKLNSKPQMITIAGRSIRKEFKALWVEVEHNIPAVKGYDATSESYTQLVLDSRKKFDTNKVILGGLCHAIATELFGEDYHIDPTDEQIAEMVSIINNEEVEEETEE